MSLWRFTDKQLKVGDQYEGYVVVDIQYRIPLSVLSRNYNARVRRLPQEPETTKQCVQLVAAQNKE